MKKKKAKEILNKKYNVSHETFKKLEVFVDLLHKWNKVHNLFASGEEDILWERHVLDSAQLKSFVFDKNVIVDIGSGGGFPGVVLAIITNAKLVLTERNKKKAVFLSEVKRILGLNLIVQNVSVEETEFDKVDIITARGVAKISVLLRYIEPHLKQNPRVLLLKGKEWFEETEEAQRKWSFSYETIDSITNEEGKILILSDIQKKNG